MKVSFNRFSIKITSKAKKKTTAKKHHLFVIKKDKSVG